jgi:hypothetical protein
MMQQCVEMCMWQAGDQRSRGQAEAENGYYTEVQQYVHSRGAAVPPNLIPSTLT